MGLRTQESRFLTSLEGCVNQLGDGGARLDYALQSLSVVKETGNRNDEPVCLGNVAGAYFCLGDYIRARQYTDEALRLHRMFGQRVPEGACFSLLSFLALAQGEDAMALARSGGSRHSGGGRVAFVPEDRAACTGSR